MSFHTVTGSPSASPSSLPYRRPSRPATLATRRTRSRSGSTAPGTPTTTPSIGTPSSPAAVTSESRRAATDASTASASASPEPMLRSSTSCRARITSAEVAEGRPQEPRAEVEPEHERRLRHRLVEHRAVRRARPGCGGASRTSPASRRASSASETVGLEMPARRAISAREIGAPSRIASSTVRSLSRLSSGGVARGAVISLESLTLVPGTGKERSRVDSTSVEAYTSSRKDL